MKKLHPHLSLLLIPIHIVWIASIFLAEINWQAIVAIILLWIIIGGIGLEIGFHRTLSQKQFTITPFTEKCICLLACYSMNGSPTFWRAMHNGYHHPYSDTKRDFHSPKFNGKFMAYVGYINNLDKLKYLGCKDIIGDPFYKFVNHYYILILWLTLVISGLISIDLLFILVSAMILCYHQTAMVNTLCHGGNLGYRNFETKDESKNIQWLAYFTFGQSLHNNHHAFPAKANYANGNHEIDPGYILSKLIRFKERL